MYPSYVVTAVLISKLFPILGSQSMLSFDRYIKEINDSKLEMFNLIGQIHLAPPPRFSVLLFNKPNDCMEVMLNDVILALFEYLVDPSFLA